MWIQCEELQRLAGENAFINLENARMLRLLPVGENWEIKATIPKLKDGDEGELTIRSYDAANVEAAKEDFAALVGHLKMFVFPSEHPEH